MCVILSIYQTKPQNNTLILEQIEQLKHFNRDGIGIVAFNFHNDKKLVRRGLEVDKNEIKNIIRNFNVVNIHLRKSTAGSIHKKNVHFWQFNNWLFAHNGMVSGYENKITPLTAKMTDSYILFETLIEKNCFTQDNKLLYRKVEKILSDLSFWGRLVIVNLKTKNIYYFGDFNAILLKPTTLIISTTDLIFGKVNRILGLKFNTISFKNQEISGIFKFSFVKRKLCMIDEIFNTSYYGNFNYGYGKSEFNKGEDLEKEQEEQQEYEKEVKALEKTPTSNFKLNEWHKI